LADNPLECNASNHCEYTPQGAVRYNVGYEDEDTPGTRQELFNLRAEFTAPGILPGDIVRVYQSLCQKDNWYDLLIEEVKRDDFDEQVTHLAVKATALLSLLKAQLRGKVDAKAQAWKNAVMVGKITKSTAQIAMSIASMIAMAIGTAAYAAVATVVLPLGIAVSALAGLISLIKFIVDLRDRSKIVEKRMLQALTAFAVTLKEAGEKAHRDDQCLIVKAQTFTKDVEMCEALKLKFEERRQRWLNAAIRASTKLGSDYEQLATFIDTALRKTWTLRVMRASLIIWKTKGRMKAKAKRSNTSKTDHN
jgi:hypothetical protein